MLTSQLIKDVQLGNQSNRCYIKSGSASPRGMEAFKWLSSRTSELRFWRSANSAGRVPAMLVFLIDKMRQSIDFPQLPES